MTKQLQTINVERWDQEARDSEWLVATNGPGSDRAVQVINNLEIYVSKKC